MNDVITADCLDALVEIPDDSIDLIYVDPPFNTGQKWSAPAGAFDDRWKSMDGYLAWIRPRIEAMYRVLKDTGSFYIHCDDHAGAYLAVLCDEIFGPEQSLGRIVWRRHAGAAANRSKSWVRVHDNIHAYAKGLEWTWRPMFGESSDLWLDLQLGAAAKERVKYPTQKPVALLERIIARSSNPGDLVLDPMCGSGTTLVAAANLGRRWIGIDTSPEAISAATKRLPVAA